MRFAALFLALSLATAFPQSINVQVGGRPVGATNTLNFESGNGIIQSCRSDNGTRITCAPAYDSAVIALRGALHGAQNYCASATRSTSYFCHMSSGNLMAYNPGLTFVLMADVPCNTQCSLNIDGLGPIGIKRSDGIIDPLGALAAGQPQWVFYDGQVFRLMSSAARGGEDRDRDRERDSTARRFLASMETIPYAASLTLQTTAGDMHKTTTSNTVGNANINAATPGLPGQHMWIIITNDQISGKTITFANNFKSAGPLKGSPGKSATLQFISDGTVWYEVARTTNL